MSVEYRQVMCFSFLVILRMYFDIIKNSLVLCLAIRADKPYFVFNAFSGSKKKKKKLKYHILKWFQRGRLKLDEDLKFSEKVQNKCTYRIAK